MKFLIVGIALQDDLIQKYNMLSTDDAKISVAAVKYTRLISLGFEENLPDDTENIYLAPLGMYPQCKTLAWTKRRINGNYYLKFLNIIFIKQFTIAVDLMLVLFSWCFRNRKHPKTVVFTSLYLPFLFAALPIRWLGLAKFVSFVPDLPAHSFSYSDTGGWLKKIFVPLYIKLSDLLHSVIDYYVFITKYMAEVFPNKPYTVIEGFTDFKAQEEVRTEKSFPTAVMYSGALFEKFGIKNLVDAFREVKGDYEMWLFGSGDMVAYIQTAAKEDSRIKFFGNLANQEILDYQKKATLLINPRFSHEEFTKFSFPSKLMEYLASGTPVLTTRLLGIPEDYQDKFYFIEDESVLGIKVQIEFCLAKKNEELQEFGQKGKAFVLNEKNYTKQVGKLISSI